MFLLEAGTEAVAGGGASMLLMIVIYVVVIGGAMYFMAVRPQKKQQKAHQEMMEALENGDYILTSSGFYGTVIDITEDTVIVEFGNNKNCRIPMKKDAIIEIEKAQ